MVPYLIGGDVKMGQWTTETIKEMYETINAKMGLDMNPEIVVINKQIYPLSAWEGKLIFVPDFFNELSEECKKMVVVFSYGYLLMEKQERECEVNPDDFAKEACEKLGLKYIQSYDFEKILIPLRRKFYQKDRSFCCGFRMGDVLRIGKERFMVMETCYVNESKIWVTIEPRGSLADKYTGKTVFEEVELIDYMKSFS